MERPIPLSVCKCENSSTDTQSTVNCSSPKLGSIFPGETLTVQLATCARTVDKSSQFIQGYNSWKFR